MQTGEDDKAIGLLEKATYQSTPYLQIGRKGPYKEALSNLGLLYYYKEDDAAALDAYRSAMEELGNDELSYSLLWNYNSVRLRQYFSDKYDNLKFCWQMYETRFRIPGKVTTSSVPNWTGGKVESITVLAEQGIGDRIMFARYLTELSKYCDKLVVQCEPELNPIFRDYEISNVNEVRTTHSIAFGSLGNLLNYVPPGEWLGGWKGGKGIGVVWHTNNVHNNKTRNVGVNEILKLSKYGNLYSLGPDSVDGRIERLPSSTWKETMESLRGLELVVSIDTAIVHLCGAMGVPCLLLMPLKDGDWRWGDSSMGENNKLYKSVKVVRNPGNWAETIARVGEIIARSKQT